LLSASFLSASFLNGITFHMGSHIAFGGSMVEAHDARLGALAPMFDTQFYPEQLTGSLIPFTDPFANDFDDNDLCKTGFACCCGAPAASHLMLTRSLGRAAATAASAHEAQRDPAAFIQLLECMCTPIFLSEGPVMYSESETVSRRARLSPEQAIAIFKMRRTKKARTAGLLATKYGISPKAVRDIWTQKSWAQFTRPHWNVK
jgi:hypothetical protein